MKKILALMFLFIFFASNLIAAPIPVKVISSSFSVSGAYQGHYFLDPLAPYELGVKTDSYDKSGATPQSGSINYSYEYPDPNLGEFASANSSAGLFSVYSSTNAVGYTSFSMAQSYASGSLTFRPLNDFDTLNYSYSIYTGWYGRYAYMDVSIFDSTNSTEIYAFPQTDYMIESATGTINYAFKNDHLYTISLNALSNAHNDSQSVQFEFTNLQRVPEPATMLLFGLGLMGLAGLRRKL